MITTAVIAVAGMILYLRPKRKFPNVVLIVADTLRADHLSFYGYDRTDTPFLASLAKRSVLFENAWAPSSWTAPSIASIFTSLYPFQHGVFRNFAAKMVGLAPEAKMWMAPLPVSAFTLAETLRNAGYRTFGVSLNPNITKKLNFDQGFDRFICKTGKDAKIANNQLREWKKEIQAARPSFVFIQYMDCHLPYGHNSPWYKPGTDKKSDLMAAYDSEICYLDRRIQEMSELFGWESDTLLIFTSDHGEEFKEHGHYGHGAALYRETIQVPLFFVLPGKIAPRRVAANVALLDILPTLTDFLGLGNDKNWAGISLRPYWDAARDLPAERVIFSFRKKMAPGPQAEKNVASITRSAVHKNWHAIFSQPPSQNQLFDWQSDPMEKENKEKIRPGFAQNLIARFLQFEKSCSKLIQARVAIQHDEQKIRELKTLGYIE